MSTTEETMSHTPIWEQLSTELKVDMLWLMQSPKTIEQLKESDEWVAIPPEKGDDKIDFERSFVDGPLFREGMRFYAGEIDFTGREVKPDGGRPSPRRRRRRPTAAQKKDVLE